MKVGNRIEIRGSLNIPKLANEEGKICLTDFFTQIVVICQKFKLQQ